MDRQLEFPGWRRRGRPARALDGRVPGAALQAKDVSVEYFEQILQVEQVVVDEGEQARVLARHRRA